MALLGFILNKTGSTCAHATCFHFSPSLTVHVFRQMYGELYLHGQREKTVVELLKVKMPGLIRLNTAAGRWVMYSYIQILFCSLVWSRYGAGNSPRPDLPDGTFHILHESKKMNTKILSKLRCGWTTYFLTQIRPSLHLTQTLWALLVSTRQQTQVTERNFFLNVSRT